MRNAAIVIVLALLSQAAAAQYKIDPDSREFSNDAAKIHQFVARQTIGQKLDVFLKNGSVRRGILLEVDADTFEMTVGKRMEKIAYSAVRGVAKVIDSGPVEKKGFWKRMGER